MELLNGISVLLVGRRRRCMCLCVPISFKQNIKAAASECAKEKRRTTGAKRHTYMYELDVLCGVLFIIYGKQYRQLKSVIKY